MALWGVVCVGPLVWMLFDSLRSNNAIQLRPLGWPTLTGLSNYSQAWDTGGLGRALIVSVLVSLGSVLLAGTCSVLAGFAISRGRLRFSNAILTFFLVGLMVPIFAALIPLVVFYQQIGLINTDWSLVLVYGGFSIPLGVFLFKNAFDTLPQELLDAAAIDGAPVPQILGRILLPMVRPTLGAFGILTFLNGYNDYVFALVLISGTGNRTLPLALLQYSSQYTGVEYNLVFAAVAIATVPALVGYLLMSRQVQSALVITGALK
jgi:raffinose/stachyose/melibiose transport system permease protein